jgi:hypothetical protein
MDSHTESEDALFVSCDSCGRVDATLRLTLFTYVMSFVVVTTRRPAGGILCSSCRTKAAFKYGGLSALLGWWGFPWGPIYTMGALGRALKGGEQPQGPNADLLHVLGLQLLREDQPDEAVVALNASLRLEDDAGVRRALWSAEGAGDLKAERSSPSPRLRAGELVCGTGGAVQLCDEPGSAEQRGVLLQDEEAVVIASASGWAEVRTTSGNGGWAPLDGLVRANP